MLENTLKQPPIERKKVKPSAVQDWLCSSAERVRALDGVLLVRKGDRSIVAGTYPDQNDVHSGLAAAAKKAFSQKRVAIRVEDSADDTSQFGFAYLAFSLRISGRPASVAFRLRVPQQIDDQSLLTSVGEKVLRRADDHAATVASPALLHSMQAAVAVPTPVGETAPDTASGRGETERQADALPQGEVSAQITPSAASESQTSDDAVVSENISPAIVGADEAATNQKLSSGEKVAALVAEQSSAINAIAAVLDQKELDESLYSFASGVAHNYGCLRVTIGLVKSRHMVIQAVSGMVDFDRRSALMVDIAQALDETKSTASTVVLPVRDKTDVVPRSHAALASQLKNPALLSLPLVDGDRVVGAILLERDKEFSVDEQLQIERLALLTAPIVALKKLESMGASEWFVRFHKRNMRLILGPKKMGLKLVSIVSLALILFSTLYTQMFRVDADAAIEATVQRAIVSSFPSFISQVEKKAGDVVRKGDVLARLDVESLQLDRIKWEGEKTKLTKEYRASLATRDRSQARILDARKSQAQSQIDLIDAQIARAILRAPVDGVVISGDLSQALGSPVERGDLLFEVASLDDFRLTLLVDETDIGWLQLDSQGELRLRSIADQTFPFTVTAITPVSDSEQQANRFRVEASMHDLPESVRPGMGGVAKIDVEPRAIGWIWTRSFVNWLRMEYWKWGGH